MGPAAIGSSHYAIHTMMDCAFGVWAKINLPSLLCFCQIFCYSKKESHSLSPLDSIPESPLPSVPYVVDDRNAVYSHLPVTAAHRTARFKPLDCPPHLHDNWTTQVCPGDSQSLYARMELSPATFSLPATTGPRKGTLGAP